MPVRIASKTHWLVVIRPPLVPFALCALVIATLAADSPSPATNAPSLPALHLKTARPVGSEPRVKCDVVLAAAPAAASRPTDALNGVIKFHGASSQGYEKKSYALALDESARWLGMRKSSHWVLNAAFVDRSLMRHKLAYDLYRSLARDGAPRHACASRFVELHLNGDYRGVYLLMERLDRSLLELHRHDSNATAHACMYKAVDHAANFSQPGHAGYEQRALDGLLVPYWKPMDEFNDFVSRAPDAEFFHPETGIASRLDLGNAMDFHLLVLLTSNIDGITKNFILYRDAPSPAEPRPRFRFSPWDYDATFGRSWEASRVGHTEWLSNHLFNRLLGNREYARRFAARWRELREREFSTASIARMIDDNAATLGDAVHRNAARWKSQSHAYPNRLTFEEDIREMKAWIHARTEWLNSEIARRTGVH